MTALQVCYTPILMKYNLYLVKYAENSQIDLIGSKFLALNNCKNLCGFFFLIKGSMECNFSVEDHKLL